MGSKEAEIDEFIKNLAEARFEEIFEDKEDLDNFRTFLRNRAIPAGGYVISYPVVEGGLHWVLFKIRRVKENRTALNLYLDTPVLFYPDDPSDRLIPEECQDFPVWWLDEQFKKQNA